MYQHRWNWNTRPWRATNPERIRQFRAAYGARPAAILTRVSASFVPLHEMMERRFGSGRIGTALLAIYPELRDRLIGDTTFRDYVRDGSNGAGPSGSPLELATPGWVIATGSQAVRRRLEAAFGPDFWCPPA